MDKTIIYYTCNVHKPQIDDLARHFLSKVELPKISVSLNKKIDFGDVRIVMKGQRNTLMMHKQIVKGLQACKTKWAFLAESDVLYHPSHFDFIPQGRDAYYFNVNVWKMRWADGFCVRTDSSQQLSGMVADKKLLLDFFSSRVTEIEKNGFDSHYEPRDKPRINYESAYPNICIRHDTNLTISKWKISDFRNKKYAKGFKQSSIENIPGWNAQEIL